MIDTDIFKNDYTLRRYGEQQLTKGHATSPYTDCIVKLNVQPLSADEMQALPEGERTVKRLKSIGRYPITAADQYKNTPGDRLFYDGHWYECVSSIRWNHTPLSHHRSEFVIVSEVEEAII